MMVMMHCVSLRVTDGRSHGKWSQEGEEGKVC